MFGSRAATRDLNLNGKEDSDPHRQNRQQQMSTGLPRFRSAPSTLLGEMCEDSLPHRSTGTDSALMFTMFPPSAGDTAQRSPRFAVEMERRAAAAASSGTVYQAREHQHLPSHGAPVAASDEVYRTARSLAMEEEQEKSGLNSSSLIRHSSSPAGLFSHLNMENGYAVMGGAGGFRLGTCAVGEAAMADARLRGQLSFSSRQSSSSTLMTQISETGEEDIGGSSTEEGGLSNGGRCYVPGYPEASWDDDPSLLPGGFSRMKRARDPLEARIEDVRSHDQILSHQYSLPKTSSEMPAILQFQDAVPCKIRAKRGCATHPRSIAERVRRTRISERIRKLQELVPNMEKQTNIADMLDLAVEYIKDLEKQVKTLSESRANCTCS